MYYRAASLDPAFIAQVCYLGRILLGVGPHGCSTAKDKPSATLNQGLASTNTGTTRAGGGTRFLQLSYTYILVVAVVVYCLK